MKKHARKTNSEGESLSLKPIENSYESSILSEANPSTLTRDLTERVKELKCLYGISRLVETEGNSLDNILRGAVELIPPSWQYSDATCARITVAKQQFSTANFKETKWKQAEIIIVNGEPYGKVEVFYLEEKPPSDEGPFLKEERNLIHAIAERLGRVIEHKHAEERLLYLYHREKELREKLQAEMRSKVDFTRNLIHELKTPLTALLATSQLLSEEIQDEKLGRLSGYVWESAKSLSNRIDDLHDLVKGEVGTLKLDLKPLNLRQLLESIVEETLALAQQSGVTLTLVAEDQLPLVYADATRVRQVIQNLLNNAFKYANDGGAVTIKTTVRKAEIAVEVQDRGQGIPIDEQNRLFEPYYSKARKSGGSGGLGIGLALCKVLIELHGGKIYVRSQPGKGTKVLLTLPRLTTDELSGSYSNRNNESTHH